MSSFPPEVEEIVAAIRAQLASLRSEIQAAQKQIIVAQSTLHAAESRERELNTLLVKTLVDALVEKTKL